VPDHAFEQAMAASFAHLGTLTAHALAAGRLTLGDE
jgi:hypothetical protein